MTRLITLVALMLWVQSSYTQEFSTHWISHPTPNDSTEVLFCHTYTTQRCNKKAILSFASKGHLKVFFNERNISQDITFNNPSPQKIGIVSYDVSRYLRPDSNTIAVWYAPETGTDISKQVSLEYYGEDADGQDFYHQADGSWLCLALQKSYIKRNKECFNASTYSHEWKASDYDRKKWLHPLGAYGNTSPDTIVGNTYNNYNDKLYRVLKPINSYKDASGIHYDFGRSFHGTIRLTLREARKTEVIHIDDFTYICNGDLDEQAFRRFSTTRQRTFTIWGDKHFKPSQITNVEGLEYTLF